MGDWQSDREEWNRQGLCAREACRTPFGQRIYQHVHTGLKYCSSCGRLLRRHQGSEMITRLSKVEVVAHYGSVASHG